MEDLLLMAVVLTLVSIATTIIMTTVMIIITVVNSINTTKTIKACSPIYQEQTRVKQANKAGRKATRKLNRKAFALKVSKKLMSIQISYLKSLVSIKTKIEAKRYAKENTIRQEFIDMANEDKARVERDKRRECREAKEVDFNYVINSLEAELYSQDKEYKRERSYTIKSLVYQNIHGQYIVADSYIVGDHGAVFNLSEFCELNDSVAKEVDQYLFNYDVLKIINERLGRDRGFQRPTDIDDELVFSHIKRGLDGFEKDAIQATFVFKVPVLKSELKILADLYNPNITHDYASAEAAVGVVLENEVEAVEDIENVIDVEEKDMKEVVKMENMINDFKKEQIAYMIEATKDQRTGLPRIKYNEETESFEPVMRTPEQIQEAMCHAIGHTKEAIDYVIAATAVNGKATQRYNYDTYSFEYIGAKMTNEEAKSIVDEIERKVTGEVTEEVAATQVETTIKSKANEFYEMLDRVKRGEVIDELMVVDLLMAAGNEGIDIGAGLKEGQSRKLTAEELSELDNVRTLN